MRRSIEQTKDGIATPEFLRKASSVVAKDASLGHVGLQDLRHACASLSSRAESMRRWYPNA